MLLKDPARRRWLARSSAIGLSMILVGCVDRTQADGDGGVDASTADGTDGSVTATSSMTLPTTGTSMGTGSTAGADGVDESSDDAMTSVGWTPPADSPGPSVACDLWLQDCADGDKCMPWSNDGGQIWNAAHCTPIAPMPALVGEPCTVEGNGSSGFDSCAQGAMCWDVNPETNEGHCVAQCEGDESNPICADPDTQCSIHNSGVLALCLPICDPLLVDCADPNDLCAPTLRDGWTCVPGVIPTSEVGEPCELGNLCAPGSVCAVPEVTPGCAGAYGCCASMCDLTDPMCPDPGTSCTGWYAEGELPPWLDDVGICSLVDFEPRGGWVDFDRTPLIDAGS